MRIIIPAAGKGLRLRPSTLSMPKPLVYIGEKRFIDYIMDLFSSIEFDSMVFITGYRGEMLEDYMKEHYAFPMEFVVQEKQEGLADAVYLGMTGVEDNEEILVLLSDTLIRTDMHKFISNARNRIAVMPVEEPERFGIVTVDNGIVRAMEEKPENALSNLAITGLYYFSNAGELRRSIEYLHSENIRTRGEYQLTDAMKRMLDNGCEISISQVEEWIDCGTNEMMLEVNAKLLQEKGIEYYSHDAVIEQSSIKKYSSIHSGCIIKDSVIENSIIGPGTEVISCNLKNSIIGENSYLDCVQTVSVPTIQSTIILSSTNSRRI